MKPYLKHQKRTKSIRKVEKFLFVNLFETTKRKEEWKMCIADVSMVTVASLEECLQSQSSI